MTHSKRTAAEVQLLLYALILRFIRDPEARSRVEALRLHAEIQKEIDALQAEFHG